MSKKLTIDFVRKEFEKDNYILLAKNYNNAQQKLKYMCPNGHRHSVSWGHWQTSKTRCPYCYGNVKPTIKFVKNELKKENYFLLTNEYENSNTKLYYICPKGHKHSIRWKDWKKGIRCPYCSNKAKYKIEFIKNKFKKEGYKLLTKEYKNNKQKLNYICPKGHKNNIRWNAWQNGQRCRVCYIENNLGNSNPNWKGGISCEPYCFEWSFKEFKDFIKERDSYKCLNPDCWGNIHRLSVHHIDYNKKHCEPENLITLCTSCNSRANKDREWHISWYKAIIDRRELW